MLVLSNWLNDSSTGSLNISEKEKEVIVQMAMPGIKEGDLKIEIEDGVLSVSSHTEESKKEEKDGSIISSSMSSSFEYSFNLPEGCDAENFTKELKDGILTLSFKK